MQYFGKSGAGIWHFDSMKDNFKSCVEISDEEYESINNRLNSENKLLSGDKNGNPILIDPLAPTEEEQIRQRVEELELYLSQTDWYAIRFADTGEPIPEGVKQKRQEARDEISEIHNKYPDA